MTDAKIPIRKGRTAKPVVIGKSLDRLMGIWSAEEAAEFHEAVSDFDHIDESLWK